MLLLLLRNAGTGQPPVDPPVDPPVVMETRQSASAGGGPDTQIGHAEWLRRFGKQAELPAKQNDDDEAIAALLLVMMVA